MEDIACLHSPSRDKNSAKLANIKIRLEMLKKL